jgi:hypothetical protein
MSKSEGNPDARPFLDALESAEKALSLSSAYIKDSKAKLSRAKTVARWEGACFSLCPQAHCGPARPTSHAVLPIDV